jgi:hypothetical protein
MADLQPINHGVPPAINLPPAGNNLNIIPRPRTFLQFYEDASKDPCKGEYGHIMARFNPEDAGSVDADQLLSQALGSGGNVPQAYLCCASTCRGPQIYLIHLPSRFTSALDGRITPWDNQCYAFLGDVTQDIATTVVFPTTAFATTANTLVYLEDHIQNNIQALNGIDVFPALTANQIANATMVTTCFLMYLPSRYATLFLNSRGYTIKHIWQTLMPLLLQNNDVADCRGLINWLRVSSHGTAVLNAQGQPVVGPPVNNIHLLSPVADQDLIQHRSFTLKLALPGLGQPAEGLESALFQMANAVVAQTIDQRMARELRTNEAQLPTLPSAKFKNTLPILMDFTQTQDELDLPLLWHQWANAPKHQEFGVLRELLDNYSRSAESFYYLAPVVSAKLVQDLLSFTFMGDSQDDLKTGLQPFMVADGSEEYHRANLELARTYGFLHDSDHGLMYADLQALEAKEVHSVPLSYFELEKSLGMFGNLLGVTLGSNHTLTAAYRQFWDLLTRGLRNDLQIIVDTTGRIKPAHILRSVQLLCYSWFNHRRARITPPAPDFKDILLRITLQSYVLPHLPPALFKLAYPQASTKYPASLAGTAVTGTLSMANTSDISVITSPTLATTITSRTQQTALTANRERGTFQANLTQDSTLQALVPQNMKLKDLIGTDEVPLADDQQPLCLSFHMRQGCWSTCRRVNTHAKTLSTGEKQRLANFALAQMAKRPTVP